VITDLNSNAELELMPNRSYYVQIKGRKSSFQTTLKSVEQQTLQFDSMSVSPENINWISHKKFADTPYRTWCRNNLRNWGLCYTPNYDLSNNYLLEITRDTTKLLLDSEQFATPSNKKLLRVFIPQLAYNFLQQAKSPFRISGHQWAKTFLNGIVIGASMLYDQGIDDGIRNTYNKNSGPFRASKYVSMLGSEVGLGFTGLWLCKGLLSNNNKTTETSLLAFQAALTATVWNRVLKYSTLRERPYSAYQNNHSAFNFRGIQNIKTLFNNSDYHSFGSGHTTTAFALATVFAEQYQDVPFVKIACYTLASSVGISRMVLHKHWSSDVLIAAMLGYACGKQVTSFKQKFLKQVSKKYKLNTSVSSMALNEKIFPTISFTALAR
jgi:membrane-associated phospholipid phosphatase